MNARIKRKLAKRKKDIDDLKRFMREWLYQQIENANTETKKG